MTPPGPQRLSHIAARMLVIVCFFFGVFHDPGEGCGDLRPPGAAAAPKNPEAPFFGSNQPPPLNPRPHPTLKCVLDAIADRRLRKAKGRRLKCYDAEKSQIRGLMF